MMQQTYSLTEIPKIAQEIIKCATYKTLLFYGNMGVGKTTLIKEICNQLGVKDTPNSPTFSLVNQYKTAHKETIYHFDFYRIKNEMEAYDIGIEEYLDSSNWCFIEWPEKVKNLLPLEAIAIHITIAANNKRTIQLKPTL